MYFSPCSYGAWKATQPKVIPKLDDVIPEGWKRCEWCKQPFKPNVKYQKYCEARCGYAAGNAKYRDKKAEKMREIRSKMKAMENGC